MPYYPPDPRRRAALPPIYQQRLVNPQLLRRQEDLYFQPSQIRRQEDFFYHPPQMRRQNSPFLNPNQTMRQGLPLASPPNQQQQFSRFGRLPEQLNTIMGHVGTVTSGVNTIKQIGSFLKLLR